MALELLEHLLDLPYAFFQQRSAGDILMRLGRVADPRVLTSRDVGVARRHAGHRYFVLPVIAAPLLGMVALGIAVVQAQCSSWSAGATPS